MSSKARNTYGVGMKDSDEVLARGLTFKEARKLRAEYGGLAVTFKEEVKAAETQGEADEMDLELMVEGDGPALGEDVVELAEVAEETPAEPEKQEISDDLRRGMRVYAMRAAGLTWRLTAELEGWSWNGSNMDGGRALRAWKLADKAIKAGTITEADCKNELLGLEGADAAIVEASEKAKAKVDKARKANTRRDKQAKGKATSAKAELTVEEQMEDLAWA